MTTLGPYTLLRRIGIGGMGEVWIARRNALGGAAKLFALKTVLPAKASDEQSRRQFLDEARLSMLMSNSNIVQVFDVAETTDGVCYMAMEYVEGIDLARLTEELRARRELLSHSAIAYIIGEILKALVYAHDLNVEGTRRVIIHRDISPQNVMLSISGEVKVMDFGIARLSSEETTGNFIRGKLRYMPPEQFKKGVRDPTIDLFAVGALLHEMLDGQRFRGGNYEEAQLLGMCMRGVVPELTCPPERVPPEFERLRKALLEPSATRRIESARAAHRLLSRWPGDRDAKFELEEIVRRCLGDSTLPAAAVDATQEPAPDLSKTMQEPAPDPVLSDAVTARREREFSQVTTRQSRESADVPTKIRGPATIRTRGAFNRRQWVAVVLACVGLGVGAVGLGPLFGWGADAAEPVPEIAEAPARLASESPPQVPAAEPAPIEKAEPSPKIDAPTTVEPAPVVEPEPAPPVVPKRKPTAVTKTKVTFKVHTGWALVEIYEKKCEFDQRKKVRPCTKMLTPRNHELMFKEDPDGDWQPLFIDIPRCEAVTIAIDIEARASKIETPC